MSAYFHKNYLSDLFRKLIFFNKAPFGSFIFLGKTFTKVVSNIAIDQAL